MARDIDVYQLIRTFAGRNQLTEVEYRVFAQALQRQARSADQNEPVFRDLSLNPDLVLAPRLFLLAKERKLALETVGNEIRSIILPERFADAFLQEYRRIDENPEIPFPDEDSLKIAVPGEWIQSISLETDLGTVSDQGGDAKVPLYRIVFPESLRPLVVPSDFVPDKLLECAVQKLRQYMRKGGNKEYLQNKLLYAFPGKEAQVKETLVSVLTKAAEATTELKKSTSDFTYSFWAYLLSVVKKDYDQKTDKTTEDVSIQQSALIIEFYANHYKGKAQRRADLESAFKTLDLGLRKAPFNFSLEEIIGFKDAKGGSLVSKLGREALEARLREKSTKAEAGVLPELIVLGAGGKRAFVAKDKALLLAVRALTEARADVRNRVVERWRKLLEDFRTSPPMEDDGAFRRELQEEVEDRFPVLDALIQSRLLPMIQEEARVRGEASADLEKLFYKGDLVPLEELLSLGRKELLADARMLLPFWYSVPILSDLVKLFRRLGKRKAKPKAAPAPEAPPAEEESKGSSAAARKQTLLQRRAEFAAAAVKVAGQLVPSGYNLDEYLRDLEGRWNTLLGAEAKRNLSEDVNSLVRDYLRGVLRTMKGEFLTLERVRSLAATLADSPSLAKIKNHQALEQYIQVYMVKVLGAGGTIL